MSKSIQEEILFSLSIIAALLAYQNGQTVMYYAFGLKAGVDLYASIKYTIKEFKQNRKP